MTNPGFGGGRGHGRGSSRGGRVDSRSHGNIDSDKLYYTHFGRYHHTRETCWDLKSKPRNVFATAAKVSTLVILQSKRQTSIGRMNGKFFDSIRRCYSRFFS